MGIDWGFMFSAEGRSLTGYVPCKNGKPIQNSGVTIGTGCDIGQMTSDELRSLDLPLPVFMKLNPYTNITKEKAVEKLKQLPLELSEHETTLLDEKVHSRIVRRFVRNFELASNSKFNEQSDQVQTVLASLALNWGPNFYRTHPEMWALIIKKKWPEVAARLRKVSKRDPLHRRRHAEAALLTKKA